MNNLRFNKIYIFHINYFLSWIIVYDYFRHSIYKNKIWYVKQLNMKGLSTIWKYNFY